MKKFLHLIFIFISFSAFSQPVGTICNPHTSPCTIRTDNCNRQVGDISYYTPGNINTQNNSLWFDGCDIWANGVKISNSTDIRNLILSYLSTSGFAYKKGTPNSILFYGNDSAITSKISSLEFSYTNDTTYSFAIGSSNNSQANSAALSLLTSSSTITMVAKDITSLVDTQTINGNLKIINGTQGAGKFLQCNAAGGTEWVATGITGATGATGATGFSSPLSLPNYVTGVINYSNSRDTTIYLSSGNQTTTSASAQNITELVFAAAANTRYMISGGMSIGCDGVNGVKVALSIPTSATIKVLATGRASTTTSWLGQNINSSATLTTFAYNTIASTAGYVVFTGEINTSSTPGNINLQFASGSAGETSTVFQLGTYIKLTRITN